MQDLMDGYFPSELQDLYPDGVPFKVKFHLFFLLKTLRERSKEYTKIQETV